MMNRTSGRLRAKRLVLRKLEDRDAESIALLAGDWDIARMTASIPYPYSVPLARVWMQSLEPDEFVRAVEHEGELIGAVGYLTRDDGSAEIGYWIGKPWWGRGFATEAAAALVQYCFSTLRMPRLTCSHFIDNPASERVIAKLGFKPFGTGSAWCDARNAEVETLVYERQRPRMTLFWRRAA
jgi:RimJ/RimL family protein N-acetyltransferase